MSISNNRKSPWTSIYWGTVEGKPGLHPFVRLTPDFMDLEESGFPHGILLGHGPFASEEEAVAAADTFDTFFTAMAAELLSSED